MSNMMDLYQKKYTILKRKCEELHQTNEKLVNRIHHMKKILKRYKRERRAIVEELDNHGDNFRDVEIPPTYELPEDRQETNDEFSAENLLSPKLERTITEASGMVVTDSVVAMTPADISSSLMTSSPHLASLPIPPTS